MTDSDDTSSTDFRKNQVVWAKRGGTEHWYPAVIIDEKFLDQSESKPLLGKKTANNELLFWLGYSNTGLVDRKEVRDFCVGFSECYRKATSDPRTLESVKVAVQLAAVRAHITLEDPTNQWLQWVLSDTFYQSLGRKSKDASEKAYNVADSKNFPSVGQLLWVKTVKDDEAVSDSEPIHWPGICVFKRPTTNVDVVLVKGSTLKRQEVAFDAVQNFAEKFTEVFQPSDELRSGNPDFVASVKRVVGVVSNQSESELEQTDWENWAHENIARYKDFCLNTEDVRDILASTSNLNVKRKAGGGGDRENGEGGTGGGKKRASDAAGGAGGDEPKKRKSFGQRRSKTDFTPEETERLCTPFSQGWTRLLVKRAPGAKKFGDVYYTPPNHKRLRSMKEIDDYLGRFEVSNLTTENFCFADILIGHKSEELREASTRGV